MASSASLCGWQKAGPPQVLIVPLPRPSTQQKQSPNYWCLRERLMGDALVGTYPWSHQMWPWNTEVIWLISLLRMSCEAETLWKGSKASKYENTPGTCILSAKNMPILWSHSPSFRNLPVVKLPSDAVNDLSPHVRCSGGMERNGRNYRYVLQ